MSDVTVSGSAGSDQIVVQFPNGSRAEATAASLAALLRQTYGPADVHEYPAVAASGLLLVQDAGVSAIDITGYGAVGIAAGTVTLTGATSATTVIGGSGGMTFATQYANTAIALAGGANLIANTGTGTISVTAGLGSTTVTGGFGSITAFVTGGSVVGGSAGNNIVVGDGGAPATIVGGGSGDFLEADNSGSVVTAGPGNETLEGGVANVTMNGGTGDDFFIMRGSGTVNAGTGNDTVGATALYSARANHLTPGGLTVYGNDSATSSTLTFYGGPSGSTVVGGVGSVTSYSAAGSDSVTGGTIGHNILIGGSGNDTLVGAGTNDYFEAGSGNASLVSGGANVQFLVNGTGADTMVGSTNSSAVDVFEFLNNGAGQNYLVNNFHVGDLLYLNSQADVNYALAHQMIVGNSDVISLGGGTGNNAMITLTNVSMTVTGGSFGHK